MTDPSTSEDEKPIRSIEYYWKLQILNESLIKWMKFYLSEDSYYDFTAVFDDYQKYLDTLNVTYPIINSKDLSNKKENYLKFSSWTGEDHFPENTKNNNGVNDGLSFESSFKNEDETDYEINFESNTTNSSTSNFDVKTTPSKASSISSGPTTSLTDELTPENQLLQFLTSSNTENYTNSKNYPFQISYELNSTLQRTSYDYNFSKMFSLTASSVEKSTGIESTSAEELEYASSENEFTTAEEENSIYSKRCELFFQKDHDYIKRGVGTLHLKQIDEKIQLLIRDNTSLSNILLDTILNDSLPVCLPGENNVLLTCVPNPPLDSQKADGNEAITMLIRVETSEDADDLFEKLIKYTF